MELSWCSCSAMAAARAAVVFLGSDRVTRPARLVAIGPLTQAHFAQKQEAGPKVALRCLMKFHKDLFSSHKEEKNKKKKSSPICATLPP